jgi:hypothetical protein
VICLFACGTSPNPLQALPTIHGGRFFALAKITRLSYNPRFAGKAGFMRPIPPGLDAYGKTQCLKL